MRESGKNVMAWREQRRMERERFLEWPGGESEALTPLRASQRGSDTVNQHHSFPQPCSLLATQEGWRKTQH